MRDREQSSAIHAHRAVREVSTDTLRDPGRGGLHGVAGEVSVAGRGLNLSMPQELAYHSQALAKRQRPARKAVPEVMNSHVLQPGARPDPAPRLL